MSTKDDIAKLGKLLHDIFSAKLRSTLHQQEVERSINAICAEAGPYLKQCGQELSEVISDFGQAYGGEEEVTGFTSKPCKTAREYYDSFDEMKGALPALKRKFGSLDKIPRNQTFKRKRNMVNLLRELQKGEGMSLDKSCKLVDDYNKTAEKKTFTKMFTKMLDQALQGNVDAIKEWQRNQTTSA